MSHKDHVGTALTSEFEACLATSRPDPGHERRFSRERGSVERIWLEPDLCFWIGVATGE